MDENFTYDVFLSHAAKDEAVARELAARLKNDGISVWLAGAELKPRERTAAKQRKIEDGLSSSHTLVICLSKNITDVEWNIFDDQATRFCDPNDSARRFIPLRLDRTEITRTFVNFDCLDWAEKSTEQYMRLLSVCRPVESHLESEDASAAIISERLISLDYSTDMMGLAFSSDGHRAITGSEDLVQGYGKLFSGTSWETCTTTKHTDKTVQFLIKGPAGKKRVTLPKSHDRTIKVWDVERGNCLAVLEGSSNKVQAVALTRDGQLALSGDGKLVRIWHLATEACGDVLEGHTSDVLSLFSSDGRQAISGSEDQTVRVWNVATKECIAVLRGHTHRVWGVALSADGRLALSGSTDRTVRLWDVDTQRCLAVFEGHTDHVEAVALSDDGQRALSRSCDGTVRMWNVATGDCVTVLNIKCKGVIFINNVPSAFYSSVNGKVKLSNLNWTDGPISTSGRPTPYTNAKVVLVGKTGVGKTGLALRLCEDRWEATESTHGMIVSQLRLGTQKGSFDPGREVWLWDLAGQADYRLIHQLYMDETALAVFVFDPQDEHTFDELGYWEKALQTVANAKGITPSKLLVAARCDRGGITVSRKRFDEFCKTHGYVGLWITGAKTNEGCDDLKAAIIENIPWSQLPWVTTTQLFRALKDALLDLKVDDTPLVRSPELRQRLQLKLPTYSISLSSLRTVIGLMEGQGVLKTLDFGNFVLLQPEQINRYATVVVRMAREHKDEMGVVPEQQVLDGDLDYKGMLWLRAMNRRCCGQWCKRLLLEHYASEKTHQLE